MQNFAKFFCKTIFFLPPPLPNTTTRPHPKKKNLETNDPNFSHDLNHYIKHFNINTLSTEEERKRRDPKYVLKGSNNKEEDGTAKIHYFAFPTLEALLSVKEKDLSTSVQVR